MTLVYLVVCAVVRLVRRRVAFGAVTAEYEVPRDLLERARR